MSHRWFFDDLITLCIRPQKSKEIMVAERTNCAGDSCHASRCAAERGADGASAPSLLYFTRRCYSLRNSEIIVAKQCLPSSV
jgi:hypothetical protein